MPKQEYLVRGSCETRLFVELIRQHADVEWRQLDISRPLDEQIKEAQQMARMLVVRHPNLVNHHGGIPVRIT